MSAALYEYYYGKCFLIVDVVALIDVISTRQIKCNVAVRAGYSLLHYNRNPCLDTFAQLNKETCWIDLVSKSDYKEIWLIRLVSMYDFFLDFIDLTKKQCVKYLNPRDAGLGGAPIFARIHLCLCVNPWKKSIET